MFSMKSVNVRGRLPDGNLSYRLCPSTEFSKGSWQMAIGSISCHSVVDQKVLCSVSSNVSVDQKYSKEGEIERKTTVNPIGIENFKSELAYDLLKVNLR